MAVLALGVHLHIGGHVTDLALPYKWLMNFSMIQHARNPSRVMAFGYLFWAVITAFAVGALFRSPSRKLKHQLGLVLIMGLGFMDFYSVNADLTPVELPAAYGPVLKDPEYPSRGFAVMNIPWDKGRYLMEQTVHGLPDLQGYIGRKFTIPLIGKLPFNNLSEQKKILKENKVKYILIRKKRMSWNPSHADEIKFYNSASLIVRAYSLAYTKVYEDDASATFRVY
jgi:hypothetical protein